MTVPTRVAVVTDSTSSLPPALAAAAGVVVVPLDVIIDGTPHREGVDLDADLLAVALRDGAVVTTAQPGPEAFARAYAAAVAAGADEIVSVHLSGALSGTVGSARLAASRAGVPVHVVDSGTVGMGLGFAALAAARAADGLSRRPAQEQVGGVGEIVRDAARTAAEHASVLFAVDSLEHLRRGGRLGPVAAALGSVLGLHPLLQVRGGRLEVVEKVRTTRRARERLIERSVADAVARRGCDLAVHHLGQPALAEQLADQLWASCGPRVRTVHVVEVSAVLGAHVGPGVLCVVVADV